MYDEYFSHAIPSSVDGNDIPLGMGMAFSQDLSALTKFASLPVYEQQKLIAQAHEMKSAEEMANLVHSINDNY